MNRVIENSKFVFENMENISFNPEKFDHVISLLKEYKNNHWLEESPVDLNKLSKSNLLNLLFIFNILSFSYWGSPKWTVQLNNKKYNGSWALIISLYQSYLLDKNNLNFEHLKNISFEEFKNILKGESVEIPLIKERYEILKKSSGIISKKFKGDLFLFFKAENNTLKLVQYFYETFPFLRDSYTYKKKKIYLDKKAQLFISDSYHFFEKEIELQNIKELSACVGYKVPQILRGLKILSYSEELSSKIKSMSNINNDDEVEIRSSAVYLCRKIRERLEKEGCERNDTEISDILWLYSQKNKQEFPPYHKIRTTLY